VASGTPRDIRLRSGNQMMAEGALQAGCRFFAGYPITPASGIFKTMIDQLPSVGGIALSAPDEISAIAYCIGASMRGFKSMTATSGPGWALMAESVQYALMTETPLVVAMVQRLGPSTGGATQGAQGDVLLVEYCTSGGYTIPVLCPTNARECFELSLIAFDWAEQLRTPVVLLSDKEVGMTTESVDFASLSTRTSYTRATHTNGSRILSDTRFRMYEYHERSDVPQFAPVGGTVKVTATGSAHNKQGKLQKNSPETLDVLMHLEAKIRSRAEELSVVYSDLVPEAETLVISYGITARAARQAVHSARASGKKVSLLIIYSLFPVPTTMINIALEETSRVIVPEENLNGLYRSVIAPLCGERQLVGMNKIGSMITPAEILNSILR
jgi:2-oxoglutarate ferredoxin oxidoreductase subunit alpha